MPYRTCSVRGCEDKSSSRHSFPDPVKNTDLFKLWIEACDNKVLSEMSNQAIFKSRKICHIHFKQDDISSNMYLKKGSIPTLLLPCSISTEVSGCKPTMVSNIEPPETIVADSYVYPSTSTGSIPMITKNKFISKPTTLDNIEKSSKRHSEVSGLDEVTFTASNSVLITPKRRKLFNSQGERFHNLTVLNKFNNACNFRYTMNCINFVTCYTYILISGRITPLASLGVTRSSHLSPKAKMLYKTTRTLKATLKIARNRNKKLTQKLRNLSEEELVDKMTASLKPHVAQFIKCQITLAEKSPYGRRYTNDDKVLGIMLHKQSSKGYKLLRKLFCLPSEKSLSSLLKTIPISAGVNDIIFNNLELAGKKLKHHERICSILFDEISLQPHIHLNIHSNEFEGFEDFGDIRSKLIVKYAQVFMLQGVVKKWKQPLAFTFSHGPTKHTHLTRMLKTIITKCQEANFKVVCSISDQGSNNQAAVNYLQKHTVTEDMHQYSKYYYINDQRIVHIYDPPHLLKGIRNNLLRSHLIWEDGMYTHTAAWADIETAFKIDNASGELRAMPKLTEHHVNPQKIRKMKVSCASQIFSHTVASVIHIFAVSGMSGKNCCKLGKEAMGTAKMLKFFDNLFDSVNGSSQFSKQGKILRTAISSVSPHVQFWSKAKASLMNMYFLKEGKRSVPPSLRNWIITLNSIEMIYKDLPKEITFLAGRAFNQDALENFFGQIRQRGARNNNPTPTQFKNHFKSLIINNLATRHSIGANCEEDAEDSILSIKNFFDLGSNSRNVDYADGDIYNDVTCINNMNIPARSTNTVSKLATGYVSGFVFKKLQHLIKDCNTCKKSIISDTISSEWHDLVLAREYVGRVPNKLKYCNPHFIYSLFKMYNIILFVLPKIVDKRKTITVLFQYFKENINFNLLCNCENSIYFKEKCISLFVKLCCHNWACGINRLLSGKDSRSRAEDCIYMQARKLIRK